MIYKARRVGKNGKEFYLWKFRTLKIGTDKVSNFSKGYYTKHGRFLRKYKLDELPQILNILKRDINLVGPRPQEPREVDALEKEIKDKILSVRPGITSLASLYFFDEEKILEKSQDQDYDYWTKIKPIKVLLDTFYVDHKCFLLDLAILYLTVKKILWRK